MPHRTFNATSLALSLALLVLLLTAPVTLVRADAQERKPQEPAFLTALLNKKLSMELSHVPLPLLIKMLSKQGGISFLVDYEPQTDVVNFKSNGTLREALDTLCENFDYTWKASKSGLIMMNKHFFHGDTLPQFHYAEIMQTARDIVNGLSALHNDAHADELRLQLMTNARWPEMLDTLASNLTPDQVRTLRGRGRLAVTSLTPAQYAQMEDIILSASLSPTRDPWAGLLAILKRLPNGYLRADMYEGPTFFAFAPLDRDKAHFPASVSIWTGRSVVITHDSGREGRKAP